MNKVQMNKPRLESYLNKNQIEHNVIKPYYWLLSKEGFTPIEIMYIVPIIKIHKEWVSVTIDQLLTLIDKHFKPVKRNYDNGILKEELSKLKEK
jgi:hypothetical protein